MNGEEEEKKRKKKVNVDPSAERKGKKGGKRCGEDGVNGNGKGKLSARQMPSSAVFLFNISNYIITKEAVLAEHLRKRRWSDLLPTVEGTDCASLADDAEVYHISVSLPIIISGE